MVKFQRDPEFFIPFSQHSSVFARAFSPLSWRVQQALIPP
jgi:hypothetical protein